MSPSRTHKPIIPMSEHTQKAMKSFRLEVGNKKHIEIMQEYNRLHQLINTNGSKKDIEIVENNLLWKISELGK